MVLGVNERRMVAKQTERGAKDLHAQDLKRHEKLDGVLGVNLGSGLSAGGGLTLHQELIMTMPGTEKETANHVELEIGEVGVRLRNREEWKKRETRINTDL
ncbi:hypothetical protein K0M31_000630 [Melipona bicolor]|uniref:Uncharacterized protein n=1 Tax=Melipona bicolor TaxID=60889 RepID=A0AA40GDX7_9HYME|nr:hypothetical protein K0M31_000630 [Melipona bicolor]